MKLKYHKAKKEQRCTCSRVMFTCYVYEKSRPVLYIIIVCLSVDPACRDVAYSSIFNEAKNSGDCSFMFCC